jgi:hypothetical protein
LIDLYADFLAGNHPAGDEMTFNQLLSDILWHFVFPFDIA